MDDCRGSSGPELQDLERLGKVPYFNSWTYARAGELVASSPEIWIGVLYPKGVPPLPLPIT